MKIFFRTTIFWFVVVSLVFAYLKGVFGPNDWAKMLFPCETKQQETTCSSSETTGLDTITTKLDEIKQTLDGISVKIEKQTDVSNNEAKQELDNQNMLFTGTTLQEKPEETNKKSSTTKKPSSENN